MLMTLYSYSSQGMISKLDGGTYLTVQEGNKAKNNDKSKTEAIFSPGVGRKEDATIIDKESIIIGEQESYSYTKKFKYLQNIFTSLLMLNDDEDIKRRISQACGVFVQAEKVLCNCKLQAITRIQIRRKLQYLM